MAGNRRLGDLHRARRDAVLDGQEVPLGDVTITNTAWQWWPPFECHLSPLEQPG